MGKTFAIFSVVAALLLGAPRAWAAPNHSGAKAERAAREFVAERVRRGVSADVVSLGRAVVFTHLDTRIAAFELEAAGLKIFLRRAAFAVGPDGKVRRAMIDALDTGIDRPPPRDPEREMRRVLARAESDGLEPRHPEAGWIRDVRERLKPVVRVEQGGAPKDDPLAVYYDAESLVPLHEEPLYERAGPRGSVFGENPVTTPEPELVELFGLDAPGDRLNGAFVRAFRCVDVEECETTEQTAVPNTDGDFAYAPDLGPETFEDPFSEVNVYYHLTRMSAWLRGAFGWEGKFGDNVWISASVGMDWYNAAYYGGNDEVAPKIIFGQDVVDMGYDADVVCHEYGHGVNRSLRSHPWFLRDAHGIDTAPQALEEGFADIWAQTFNGDPVMDTYVPLSRTADNELSCPNDLVGEGHYEARIVAGFGWDVRTRIGALAWNHIVYRTLPFLESSAGFSRLVEELVTSAEELAVELPGVVDVEDAAFISEEAAARGLLSPECRNRHVPLEDGIAKEVYGFGRPRTGKRDRPFGLQWVLEPGEGQVAFHLALEGVRPEDAEFGYRVHLRRGAPVEVTWLDVETVAEGDREFEVVADLTIEGSPAQVNYPDEREPPLAPGEKVYALLSADSESPIFVIRAMPYFLGEQPLGPVPDAGPPPEDRVFAGASPRGGSCAMTASEPNASSLLGRISP